MHECISLQYYCLQHYGAALWRDSGEGGGRAAVVRAAQAAVAALQVRRGFRVYGLVLAAALQVRRGFRVYGLVLTAALQEARAPQPRQGLVGEGEAGLRPAGWNTAGPCHAAGELPKP